MASPVAAAKPAPAPTGPPAELKMGYSNITGDELALWVALDTAIFTRQNLKVDAQLIAGGVNTMAALLSGQVQIAQGGGSEALSAVAGGADLVVVAVLSGVYPYLFEVIPEIKSPADLVGKKLGVANIGGSADIATRVVLRRVGIDPEKDVAIVATGSAQNRTAALISGAIQGGMTAPPEHLAVEAIGLHPLFDLASLKLPAANTAVVLQRSFVSANRPVVQRYVDSLIEATVQLKRDKPGTVAVLKNYFKSDDEKAMDVTYEFYAKEVLTELPFPKPEQFKDSVEQLTVTNPRVREVDLGKLLDTSFVQNAADRGLGR
jgi:ABC-type nitrate/sulfonate/bicarbonate transport system substrate-binding protein